MTKKPSYRFVGYIEPWAEKKLGEVGETKSGVGFPDSEQGGVRGIPFYKVSDMNNIGNEIEMVTSNNYVTQEQIDSRKWKVIDTVPAIMFAKVGAALLLNRKRLIREPFLIDNNTMAYIPSAYWDIMFCKILFDTLNLSKYSQVGALPSYNGSDIEAIQVSLPSLPEQTAIGSFFQDIDQLISLQQRKLDVLKEQKKTYLKLLFPAKGQTKPALRFAGFEDEWKEVKVSDIFRVTRGQVLATTEISAEKTDTHKYPVYSSQTKNEGLLGYYDKYLFETAITWTTDGANAGTVNYREGKFYSTNVNGVLLSDEGFANKVVAEILNNEAWKYVSKVGNPKLMNNVMSEINLVIPNDFREISILSTFFQDLDKAIAKQEEKVNQLKESKQTLLRKMFI